MGFCTQNEDHKVSIESMNMHGLTRVSAYMLGLHSFVDPDQSLQTHNLIKFLEIIIHVLAGSY